MRTFAPIAALAVALSLIAASCKRTEDEAARQRIFSPEEPVGVLAEAKEPIDARRLADDPQLARRVLHMSQEEAAARLGAHKAQTRVQFAWFRGPGLSDGGSEVSLAEETSLSDGPRGDFTLRSSNDHNQGFQIDWVAGQAFVKSLYGPFRKRRTDRTDPVKLREQALAALPSFDRLARGLKLKLSGETTFEGRKAIRYAVSGFGAGLSQDERALPPLQFPAAAGGKSAAADPDTARRLELFEKEEPAAVSGSVLIDAETSTPLAADLQGHFKVPAAGKDPGPAAELDLHSVLVTQAIGRDPGLKEPQFEPEPSVPHAVKDPLRFLGKLAPGTAGKASTEEPIEDEEKPTEEDADSNEPAAPETPAPRPAKEPKK